MHAPALKTIPMLVLGATCAALALTADPNESAEGWASQEGGTTGGKGGTVVTATSIQELKKYAAASEKSVIYVKGVMGDPGTKGVVSGDRVVVASNKTILGLPGAWVKGGFDIKGASNIIVRNLRISGPGATSVQGNDAVHIEGVGTKNIWFDHCEVFDGMDGNFDITNGADLVTVTWCKFFYTAATTEHQLSNLIGGSTKADIAAMDRGHLRVTLFKNWWADGVAERQPRVRFGKVHVINNFYNSKNTTTGVRVGQESSVLIEKNVFVGLPRPIDIYNSVADGQTETGMAAKVTPDNVFTNIPKGNTASFNEGSVFTPPYKLSGVLDGTQVEKTVSDAAEGAGATIDAWSGGQSGIGSLAGREASLFPCKHSDGTMEIGNASGEPARIELLDISGRILTPSENVAAGQSLRLKIPDGLFVVRVAGPRGTWIRLLASLR